MSLTTEQVKVINSITNLIQELPSKKDKNDLAYMIHNIIDGQAINYELLACYKLKAKADWFLPATK